ncbi:MAG TPA: outer membrane beta-barrel protein, partial [Gammaproteobacteria bacterium]|nr:outer membrane beta-barrel protein [Gammaproteobacteria bacterium]
PLDADVSQDIARVNAAELFYYDRWWGVGADIRLYWSDEDYEAAILDERVAGVALRFGYPLAPSWEGALFGRHENSKYPRLDRRDRRSVVGVGVSHRLARRLSLVAELRDEWQRSDAAGRDFNEVIALIELRYGARPHWAAR